jgi:hypothetical protein
MEHGMTPTPNNKKGSLKIVGALILTAIICIVIAIFAIGVFSTPSPPPHEKNPAQISLTPDRGAAGTTVSVTIAGSNFTYGPNPSVWLAKTGANKITATDVMVISQTQIKCTFYLPASTSAGQWDVVVTSADGQSGSKIGAFTVVNENIPLKWDWSRDGWGDWQHAAACPGTANGSCSEYGPVIVSGHGEHGSNVVDPDRRVPTESSVSKTFTAPSGTTWNTATFSGLLSHTILPDKRWIAIDVNGVRVFYANATQTPPGNNQQFNITQSFPQANRVTVTISNGQDPTWSTPLYTMQFNSLTLS